MKHNFDFTPTFLGSVGSSMEYYHNEFIRWKQAYIEELKRLKEMENPQHDPVCVKTFELKEFDHPRTKARFYGQIDAYIKHNHSATWVYSHIEESIEEVYADQWDDYPENVLTVKVYALLKDKNTVVNSGVYKAQVKLVQECLVKIEESKERFVEYMQKEK